MLACFPRARRIRKLNAIQYLIGQGTGNYNGVSIKVTQRFASGLTTLVGYTWSKSLDNSSGYFGVENGAGQNGSAIQNFFNPTGNYGPSGKTQPRTQRERGPHRRAAKNVRSIAVASLSRKPQ